MNQISGAAQAIRVSKSSEIESALNSLKASAKEFENLLSSLQGVEQPPEQGSKELVPGPARSEFTLWQEIQGDIHEIAKRIMQSVDCLRDNLR